MFNAKQPLIIGHRGAASVAPENTLAAFNRALSDGADGIEFDVQLARDGAAVVIHDATLQRTTPVKGKVAFLTSEELSTLDAGSWFNLRFPLKARDEYRQERIPKLAEVLQCMRNRNALIYIEMKCQARESQTLTAEVARLVREYSFVEHAVVESFNLEAIREIKRIAPEIRTAALFERKLSRPVPSATVMLEAAIDCGAEQIALQRTLVNRRITEAAARHGLQTIVWTVDDLLWVRRRIRYGLSAIITNDPALMRSGLPQDA